MELTGGNRSTWGKTCPSTTLPTTNPTRTEPGLNLGLRSERPANNPPEPRHGPNNSLKLSSILREEAIGTYFSTLLQYLSGGNEETCHRT
jgi:hypothetical protein